MVPNSARIVHLDDATGGMQDGGKAERPLLENLGGNGGNRKGEHFAHILNTVPKSENGARIPPGRKWGTYATL